MITTNQNRTDVGPVVAGLLAAGALALGNHLLARRAERRHPAEGSFITVDGVKLHYSDRGHGSPVVLIHGNAVTGADWNLSGVADLLLRRHRVIIFDRPGYGYSERPRDRVWTAARQAELLYQALQQLGVRRPVVVGHSWGTMVALGLAIRHQAELAGLVLISGYYDWTLRPDVLPPTLGALPVIGDVLCHTISPLIGWLKMPLLKRAMFAPTRVPARFQAGYSTALALRPSQLGAMCEDGALMIPSAIGLRRRYRDLTLPVVILAGKNDRVVFKERSERLAPRIRGSRLQIVDGTGHMLHYVEPALVARAVEEVSERAAQPSRPAIPAQLVRRRVASLA
jgi:pimeloyl-ACP methyl ester carboxylesterase